MTLFGKRKRERIETQRRLSRDAARSELLATKHGQKNFTVQKLILGSPSTIIMCSYYVHKDDLIQSLLDCSLVNDPYGTEIILLDTFSRDFWGHQNHPAVSKYCMEYEEQMAEIENTYQKLVERLEILKNVSRDSRFNYFTPLYLFMNNFSRFTYKEHENDYGKLMYLLTCASTSGIRVITFDKPGSGKSYASNIDYFASYGFLPCGWDNKYREYVPKVDRSLLVPGNIYFNGYDKGIYAV